MKRLRLLFLPLSAVYLLIVVVRNWLFDAGLRSASKAEAFVIAVGNLSAGGSGKTPLVEWLLSRLLPVVPVGVVSRGYGRSSRGTVLVQYANRRLADPREAGDELTQIADSFRAATVIADEQRVRGARKVVELGAKVIVLDDAFQHRMIQRDVDLVVLTAREVLRGDWLLPAGNRREPAFGLRRATALVVTRCLDDAEMDAAAAKLRKYGKPIVFLNTTVFGLVDVSTRNHVPVSTVAGKRAVAFSGIGDPASFERTLAGLGVTVVEHVQFGDHHWYSPKELLKVRAAWADTGADVILTTQKDVSRLSHDAILKECPLYEVLVGYDAVRGGEVLDEIIRKATRA